MKIIDVITFMLLLIFPEISEKKSRKFPNKLTVIICRLIVILTKLGQCVLFLFLLKFTLLDWFTIFITAHGKASFASGLYAMGGISVCLSVCLSHSGIMSKRGDAEGCSLYHRVAQCLRFFDAKNG